MKTSIIILIGVSVVIVLVLFSAFILVPMLTPSPERTLGPESSSPSTFSRSIEISYTVETSKYRWGWYGSTLSEDIFLIVNMTIKNNGYDSFSTSPYNFFVVFNNIEYDHDILGSSSWDSVNVLDGGTYNGVIKFQIPETATAETVTLGYERPLFTYNIIWTKN